MTNKATRTPKLFHVFCTVNDRRHRVGAADSLPEAKDMIAADLRAYEINPRDALQMLIGPPPQRRREYAIFAAEWTLAHSSAYEPGQVARKVTAKRR